MMDEWMDGWILRTCYQRRRWDIWKLLGQDVERAHFIASRSSLQMMPEQKSYGALQSEGIISPYSTSGILLLASFNNPMTLRQLLHQSVLTWTNSVHVTSNLSWTMSPLQTRIFISIWSSFFRTSAPDVISSQPSGCSHSILLILSSFAFTVIPLACLNDWLDPAKPIVNPLQLSGSLYIETSQFSYSFLAVVVWFLSHIFWSPVAIDCHTLYT